MRTRADRPSPRSPEAAVPERPTPARLRRFAITTVVVSVLFWVLGSIRTGALISGDLPLSALMFTAPGVGLVAALGRAGTGHHLRRSLALLRVRWRAATRWLPVMPLTVLASSHPPWSGPGAGTLSAGSVALLAVGLVLSATVEQLGWMWFTVEGLTPRWGLVRAGLTAGAAWAGLHVIPWLQAGRAATWVVGQSVFSAIFLYLIARAYGGEHNLPAAVVLHASYDVTWVGLTSAGGRYDPFAVALGTAALVLAVRAGWSCEPRRIGV
jgi:hypothetical protein